MKKKQLNILQQIAAFDQGLYDSPDVDTQIDAGWFDWFCKDNALKAKTKSLYTKLKRIVNSGKFDPKKTYVFFKNNCPMNGRLYDSFSICDLDTGNVIFWVCPKSGHTSILGKAELTGEMTNFEKPIVLGEWQEVVDWFNRK